jgi:hypothetical protein
VARWRIEPYGGGVRRALRSLLRFARVLLTGVVLLVATAPALGAVAEPWAEVAAMVATASAAGDATPPEVRRARATRPAARAIPVATLVAVAGGGPRAARVPAGRLYVRHCALLC